jgi:serine/threonine-protein kinase RsbW
MDIVNLSVPGSLKYRDVVLRMVTSCCRLVRAMATGKQAPSRDQHEFDHKVLSAVGEAFNNVAIHAYRGISDGALGVKVEMSADGITIHMTDTGRIFEPALETQRGPEALPESHMGLFLMRSCVDKVTYRPGIPGEVPNQLTLTKRFVAS